MQSSNKKQEQALYHLRKNYSINNQIELKKQRAKTLYIIKKVKNNHGKNSFYQRTGAYPSKISGIKLEN